MGTLPADQNTKSPAFSFYAKDWLAATLTWALDARGAYVTLLAYQWDSGSVPGNDAAALAKILGVSTLKAKAIWKLISHKFDPRADGAYVNTRLEDERKKQAERRAALKANGARGGRPPNNQTQTNRLSETEPNDNQLANLDKSLSSSSSFASSRDSNESQKRERASLQGSGAYEPGSLPRDHKHHALCGPNWKICLKSWEYNTLAKAYNNPDEHATRALLSQFVEVLEKSVTPNETIGPFSWVEKNFHVWLKSIGKAPAQIKPIKDESEQLAKLAAIERGERIR